MTTRPKRISARPGGPNGHGVSDDTTRYAQEVVAGKIITGPWVRLACKRHLNDMKRKSLVWDVAAANHAIEFFPTVLRLSEGQHASQPFHLTLWQKFIIGSIFGWRRKKDGFRRFSVAYVEAAKGNGKTPLAAGVGLYMLTADGEPGAEVYAAAVTRDQAKIMFRDAENMVEQAPALAARLNRTVNQITYRRTSSFFKAISSEGRQLDGKRVHCALIDEVHEHPSPIVVEKMRAGLKGRDQGLVFMITNSGHDRETVCWHWHQLSIKVLQNSHRLDSLFCYVCALDDGDSWEDENVWIKANPNLNVSIKHRYLREQVAEARGMPSKSNLVRRLNFCQWTEADEVWLERDLWDQCEAAPTPERTAGAYVIGSLDLSGTRDLTAFTMLWSLPDGKRYTRTWFWLPGRSLAKREIVDGMPWTWWRDQGWLRVCDGDAIDRRQVGREVAALLREHGGRAVAFDRYRVADLIREMETDGIATTRLRPSETLPDELKKLGPKRLALIDWGQGWRDMSPAIEAAEDGLLNGKLYHEGNPILTMCVANAVVVEDDAGNRKFSKRRASGYIDGAVTLAMAAGLASKLPATLRFGSIYAKRGLELL